MSTLNKVKTIHRIPNTNIVIDEWGSLNSSNDRFIRFMTVLRIDDSSLDIIKQNTYKIHTTAYNKYCLEHFFKIPADRIVTIRLETYTEIRDEHSGSTFKVYAINSNYCAGSCMFLFQGTFGNILFTGFFRMTDSWNPSIDPILKPLVDDKAIDVVYIDNSYAAEHCCFPSKKDVVKQIISLIREHPQHKIIISGNKFGKEEILIDIARSVNENICITESKYKFLQSMGMEEYFSTNEDSCRIKMIDEVLSLSACKKKQAEEGLCIIILLTSSYECEKQAGKNSEPKLSCLHILPYSSHASHSELMTFLSHLKPRNIRAIIQSESENNIIPKKMMELRYRPEDSAPFLNSDYYFATCSDALDSQYLHTVTNHVLESPIKENSNAIETNATTSEAPRQESQNFDASDVTPRKVQQENIPPELLQLDTHANVATKDVPLIGSQQKGNADVDTSSSLPIIQQLNIENIDTNEPSSDIDKPSSEIAQQENDIHQLSPAISEQESNNDVNLNELSSTVQQDDSIFNMSTPMRSLKGDSDDNLSLPDVTYINCVPMDLCTSSIFLNENVENQDSDTTVSIDSNTYHESNTKAFNISIEVQDEMDAYVDTIDSLDNISVVPDSHPLMEPTTAPCQNENVGNKNIRLNSSIAQPGTSRFLAISPDRNAYNDLIGENRCSGVGHDSQPQTVHSSGTYLDEGTCSDFIYGSDGFVGRHSQPPRKILTRGVRNQDDEGDTDDISDEYFQISNILHHYCMTIPPERWAVNENTWKHLNGVKFSNDLNSCH